MEQTKRKSVTPKQRERVYTLFEKTRRELMALEIPISPYLQALRINTRTRKRLGACIRNKSAVGRKSFIIEVSASILPCDDEQICTIIAHELLHTCRGCFDHGKKWKEYARHIELSLGYHITRTADSAALGLDMAGTEAARYTIVCCSCGQRFERRRRCPLVLHTEKYRCGKCGGKLKLL